MLAGSPAAGRRQVNLPLPRNNDLPYCQTAGHCAIIQVRSSSLWLAVEWVKNQPSTTHNDSTGFAMQPDKTEDALLDKRLDDICIGFTEAIDREVERRRREGLPIYVAEDGKVIDLQVANSTRPGR